MATVAMNQSSTPDTEKAEELKAAANAAFQGKLKNTLLLSEILMKCLICDQVWEWVSVVKLLVILMESVSSNQSTHLYNDRRKFCYCSAPASEV